MSKVNFLAGYPAHINEAIQALLAKGQLGDWLLKKYPTPHSISNDKALYQFGMQLKNQYMRQSAPISKIVFDDKIQVIQHALGTHSFVSRVQGGQLKTKHEIRIASVFKQAPLAFLNMIMVHELAHLKEKEHNKAFYQLCCYMEANYHHIELDLRVYLTYLDTVGKLYP